MRTAALILALSISPAFAGEPVPKVYDGDTFRIAKTSYRVAGVDTPEIGWRARCAKEAKLAIEAREATKAFLARPYTLTIAPGRDRYGRTLIQVNHADDGVSLSDYLIRKKLGVAYFGRGKRADWCAGEALGSKGFKGFRDRWLRR